MMKSSIFYFLLVFFFISDLLYANGGPIDWSNVLNCGDIKLVNAEKIDVIKEHLKIKIIGDYSHVSVTYTLDNKSDKAAINYGFPIDIIQSPYDSYFEIRKEDLPEILFKLNNELLPLKHQLDFEILDSSVDSESGLKHEIRRSWHIVDLNLKKGQYLLEVSFVVKNYFFDDHYSNSFFNYYGDRNFIYDFSPASRWGNGIVNEFLIEVDAKDIIKRQGEIKIKGLDLSLTSDSLYIGNFRHFDLSKCQNLQLSYSNKIKKLSDFINQHRYTKYYLLDIWINDIRLTDYFNMSLFDDDLNTSIKVRIKNNKPIVISFKSLKIPIGALAIINDCNNIENETFSKVQKFKISIKYEDAETFEDYHPNEADGTNTGINKPLLKFLNANGEALNNMLTIIMDLGEEQRKIDELMIECLEFQKGTKDILCIPEIYLLQP